MWTRAELKENANKYLWFNYWKMVLAALVMMMVGGGGGINFRYSVGFTWNEDSGYTWTTDSYRIGKIFSPENAIFFIGIMVLVIVIAIITAALSAFLLNPIVIGVQRFFVVSHYQKADLNELAYGFSNAYMNVVKTMFMRQMYIFLWSMLFVIPGIIKGYEYRMIPYILAEHPDIDPAQAFAVSKQMMDGNKWNAFVLDLSFIGWWLLSAITCNILAIFYVHPYTLMTSAELYVVLKEITYGGRGQNSYRNDYQSMYGNNNHWDA